jgi:hypothetical protein
LQHDEVCSASPSLLSVGLGPDGINNWQTSGDRGQTHVAKVGGVITIGGIRGHLSRGGALLAEAHCMLV